MTRRFLNLRSTMSLDKLYIFENCARIGENRLSNVICKNIDRKL